MFREDFIWGVASSAYQIEGTDSADGRGKTVWDMFTEGGRVYENQNAYTSCDHMHHYKEDIALMKHLGIHAYRFSLNWARILPEGTGRVNEQAIEMYRDMILTMKENGITPYITLFHWEFPLALYEQGGWMNPKVVDWFGEYAKVVAERFSDLCEYFITINEPQCVVGLGHLSGVHAPGVKLSVKETFLVAHHLLMAHGQAVINLRKYAGRKIKVGYAPTGGVAYPYTDSPADIEAAKKVYFGFYNPIGNWTWNVSWFSDPVFLGHYPAEGLEKFAEYLPEIKEEDMKLIYQPLDFMGQNIYNGYYVRAGENGEPEFVSRAPGFPKTGADWPVTPEAFYYGIKFLTERYPLPLYITENGMSCHDIVSSDGRVHDPNRITFLGSYIGAMQRAYDEGANVAGYFLWTFLDNFEWADGYRQRFGIVHVDFTSQRRIVKDSAYWYKNIIKTNGKALSMNQTTKEILFLNPVCTHNIWGGTKLREQFGYPIEGDDIGECWGISAHPNGDGTIRNGVYAGMKLSAVWEEHPEVFGNLDYDRFPLLAKIIDARDDLSIQVHPEDAYAKEHENGSFGKTECWYIMDAPENATLVIGHNAKTREELSDMIRGGRWNDFIREIPVKKGDFIQIDPGTVHAIKGGILILETQQRLPKNQLNELYSCSYYDIFKLDVAGEASFEQKYPFMLMSVIEGSGIVNGQPVKKGDHFILPCGFGKAEFTGEMSVIASTVTA